MSDIKQKYQQVVKRFSEFNLEPEQLLSKLNQIMELAIESTEERINPKLNDPIEVKVRNLAVARACVTDLISFRDKILKEAQDDLEQADIRYELVQSWIDEDGSWSDDSVITSEGDNAT